MSGHYAYLLATTRRDQYYIDLAPTREDIRQTSRDFNVRRELSGRELWDPAMLVWHVVCESQAAAQDRAAEIRAWPHRWQRRLVETHNPYWLSQDFLREGWPPEHWYVVPETMPAARPTCGPHGVPPEIVAQLKVQYNSAVFPSDAMRDASQPKQTLHLVR